MLTKALALAQSKVAIAVLGLVIVGGGGGAAAVATGHTPIHFQVGHVGASSHTDTTDATDATDATETPGAHAHTVGVVGLLTACGTNTISVLDQSGKTWQFTVDSSTRINGAVHAGNAGAGATAATLTGLCATSNVGVRSVQVQADQSGSTYTAWKITLQGSGKGTTKGGAGNGSTHGASSDHTGGSSNSSNASSGAAGSDGVSHSGSN